MPNPLSAAAMADKNKITSNIVWMDLLEIQYPDEDPVRVCNNGEAVTWGGHTWSPSPFVSPESEETKDAQVPDIQLRFWDVNKTLIPIIDDHGGGIGATVIVRTVLSNLLGTSTCERQEEMEILETAVTSQGLVTFSLGAENLACRRCPPNRYLKNHCRYRQFKDDYCGYAGAETACDRTFARCKELGNQARFGGMPAIGRLGYKV